REKRVEENVVAAENSVIDPRHVGSLQIAVPGGSVEVVPERLKYRVGVPVDVHEARVRKHLQQQPDPRGVRGRLEDERSAVLESQLLQKPRESGFPFIEFLARHIAEGEISRVVLFTPREA